VRRTIWIVSTMALMAVVAAATAWAAFALWFRLPVPTWGRSLACALFVALGLATIAALFGSMRLRALAMFLVNFIALVGWWSTIKPPAHADWAADVARQATGVLDGDLLTVKNVRNFDWRSDTDCTEAWTTRSYDLTYSSITTNCTTTIFKMIRAVGDMIPLDWRIIVNGYLPDYAYSLGALDSRVSLAELRDRAHVDERARKAGLSPDFSHLIRVGVPSPLRDGP
jgi:hypothetical protein